jgi:hypothetical protein
LPEELEVESPEWWLQRLSGKLDKRRSVFQLYKDYYEGQHKLAFATKKFREAFGGLFSEFADNWCSVVVQAPAERLKVQGISLGSGAEDQEESHDVDAWHMWQENELDAWSGIHHTEILTTGYGYILAWSDDNDRPAFTIEDAQQVICDYRPGQSRRPAAALKRWSDDWDGHEIAYLYLPDGIYKFRSEKPRKSFSSSISPKIKWTRFEMDDEWPLQNPIGRVPIVEFVNDPTVLRHGRSELRPVIPMQNAINKMITDMLLASEYSAYKQRYILGWTPETNQEGLPNESEVRAAVSRMLTFEAGDEKIEVGEFSATDLNNFVVAVDLLVQHLAAQTRTPRHYLFQQGQSPSGDAIKSAETGLVAKVGERMIQYGEPYEEVIRLGFRILGDKRMNAYDAEIIWGDPEYRTEGEKTDAVIKRVQAGLITWVQALRDLGYTPQQIEEMRRERARDALMQNASGDLAALLGQPAPEPEPAPEPAGQ